ncbi:MAG TPA: rhodanese-like domain-containing protein [Syntrophales bacterium]|nr:rhodanese-like domain-containing protein [Syntrophales bacterium]
MQKHNKNIFISSAVIFCLFFSISSFAQADADKQLKEIGEKSKSISTSDPWTVKNVITVDELAVLLNKGSKEVYIYQVGFKKHYSKGHIKGAVYAGPASEDDGLQLLNLSIKDLPRDKDIILYCGCCPWTYCPNIRPAFETVDKMGFKNIKVLYLPENFTEDWVNKGLAVEK